MMLRQAIAAFVLLLGLIGPAAAVNPDEVLDDPALEARARTLSLEFRCLVCQNQSIDDSNAEIARDLRLLVRERLTEGDSDAEVLAFVTDRYGEFVLFRPPFTWRNAVLWLSGPLFLLLGAGLAFAYVRRRSTAPTPPRPPLTPEERARLEALTNE